MTKKYWVLFLWKCMTSDVNGSEFISWLCFLLVTWLEWMTFELSGFSVPSPASVLVILLPAFPGGSDGKEFACNARDLCLVPGWGRYPWKRAWQPTSVFLPAESHGQRNLAVYSPRGRESDTAATKPHTAWNQMRWCNNLPKGGLMHSRN